MKHWKKQNVVESPLELPVIPEFVKVPEITVANVFECLSCSDKANVLFEGSSFCRSCLKEKLRVGR
jgi:hypothetical protein